MFARGISNKNSLEDIITQVNEYQILKYYFNINSLPCVIKSPLRVDKHPSFGITLSENFKVKFKDFATGENGNIFTLLKLYCKISFQELINKIYSDIEEIKKKRYNNINLVIKDTKKDHITYNSSSEMKVKVREWKESDLEYWKQYGIELPLLIKSNTYPISHIIIKKKDKSYTFGTEKYAFAYIEYKDNTPSIKTYQPYSKEYKWRNNHNPSVWDLWDLLPAKGNTLIITSSRKDALTIINNTGTPATSLQAEGYFPKKQVINELKGRFKKIFIFYDNDFNKPINYGHNYGAAIAKEFKLIQIEIPTEYMSKDPSDLYKNHGKEIFISVLDKLIN